ncbi:transaldolase [Maribacter sp. MJ134]|uniref:TlpA family protein disulfide reductase n=1 Tax=Maribacter sp. MJ134 TaxID=2496865 RepID=UPI000F81E5B9|nr:transaldolase [Maribacter sp. MJ134]AZQ58017.1 transaldolase [Maribacter sp. MJ134]
MNRYLLLLLIFSCLACESNKSASNNIYFTGEIVNPTDEYVVLFKGSAVIDSAKLDGNNRFSFNLDSTDDGLFHFNHAPEYQYVYLEKGDTLLVRLNTQDFDESLVFSGTNEEVNNFLLELFLANEEEERLIRSEYFNFEADDFQKEIDALADSKIEALNAIKLESGLSEKAYEIAKASIDYTYYGYKEIYPFEHKRKLRENTLHEVTDDFYAYRKHIDYNNESLIYLRPYYDFMKSHFGNLSYMTCSHSCGIKGNVVNNQLHFNKHKLHVIDSLVVEKELRDNLFRNVAFNYLLKEHDAPENNKVFLDEFEKVSQNNMHIEEIENLYNGIRNIQPQNKIPAIPVVSFDGVTTTLTEISKDKKVVFYFWSATNKNHYKNIFKRVDKLEQLKKDHTFVGINIKTEPNNWEGIIKNFNLDTSTQFRTDDFEGITNQLVIYPMNKCIITEDTLIVDAFSNIYERL